MRLGVDIGGTFTDILAVRDDGSAARLKTPSTPHDYAIAIREGLRQLADQGDLRIADLRELIHGTTVAANAILSRTYARTGLITTEGFRDVLEIGRLRMPRLYDLTWEKPQMLVPRYLRFTVAERIRADGSVASPLDEESLHRAIEKLLAEKVDAVAVCLLNSYVNAEHEQRVGRILRGAADWDVAVSCEVLPEIKEYERTSTTVVNACLIPVVRQYLQTLRLLANELNIEKTPLWIMMSGGGVTDVDTASLFPVKIIESGPAAGVVAAATVGVACGYPDVIAFDMGGTTAKAALVENGVVPRATDFEVGGGISSAGRLLGGGGYPVRVPCVDLAEVGAGGGSLLQVDDGGVLQVGPQSAGADPGPVCYGQGGAQATLTDANLVLGYLNPVGLAGGSLPLHLDAAAEAIAAISSRLRLTPEEAALGAHHIAVARMVRAVRAVSSERGRDPGAYTLVASGGSGPLHAAAMAAELGIPSVIVPPAPGLFSAFGLLAAPLEFDAVKSSLTKLSQMSLQQIVADFEALDNEALSRLPSAQLRRSIDLRYTGQSSELNVPLPPTPWIDALFGELGEAFERLHERNYGHRAQGDPIEAVAIRIHASLATAAPAPDIDRSNTQRGSRRAYFGAATGWLETDVIARSSLRGDAVGPLIIEDYDATTLVPPTVSCRLDDAGNIELSLSG